MDILHPELRSHQEAGRRWPVLVWRAVEPLRTVTSAPHGGGLGLRRWVLNAQVPSSYGRCDADGHLGKIAACYRLEGPGAGMLTAAAVLSVHTTTEDGVQVAVTLGLGTPTWAAAPDMAGPVPVVGTINVLAFVPEGLADAALVNTIGTATEAKAQALWDFGVPATGTATDAVCVTCPDRGPLAPFGGPRSPWGARLARAVHGAVGARLRAVGPH